MLIHTEDEVQLHRERDSQGGTEFGLQFLDARNTKGHSFETRISKCVTNMVLTP